MPVDPQDLSVPTPSFNPDARSWEERQLTTIILRAAESAIDHAIAYRNARRIVPAAILRELAVYLIDAMEWFDHARPEPDGEQNVLIAEISFQDMFEEWLIERWLKHARSEAYQDTAEYQFLRGEWERGL